MRGVFRGATTRQAQSPAPKPALLQGSLTRRAGTQGSTRTRPRVPKQTETPHGRGPREPRPVLLRRWGKGCKKVRLQSFGVIWHQGGQIPSLTSSPHPSRSHPFSKQAPHFPASSCSRAFFLIPQVPVARRNPGGLRVLHHNYPTDRNGQGSRGSPGGTQRRNTGAPSPAHSELIGISHFPHLHVFAAVRTADRAPELQEAARPNPARPDPSPCSLFGF